LSFAMRFPWSVRGWFNVMMRTPNLTSAASNGVFFCVFILIPFGNDLVPPWMALAMLPSMLLTGLGLVRAGYRITDLFAVLALSVLLIPVNLSGTLHSLRQAVTGRKIPFARTPKIDGRTPTPKRYLVALCLFILYAAASGVIDVWFGKYSHAGFAAINAAIVLYCIVKFIGVRHLLEDLGVAHLAHSGFRSPADYRYSEPRRLTAKSLFHNSAAE